MLRYIAEDVELCRTCSLDSRTVGNMVSLVLPRLEREAADLRRIRESMAEHPEQLARWAEAGFLAEEQEILSAIEVARERLGIETTEEVAHA